MGVRVGLGKNPSGALTTAKSDANGNITVVLTKGTYTLSLDEKDLTNACQPMLTNSKLNFNLDGTELTIPNSSDYTITNNKVVGCKNITTVTVTAVKTKLTATLSLDVKAAEKSASANAKIKDYVGHVTLLR